MADEPHDLHLRRELAAALERAARYDEALAEYAQLIERRPEEGALYLAQARCQLARGEASLALASYERAVALDLGLADAPLRDRIVRAEHDPRSRIRLVAGGGDPPSPKASEQALEAGPGAPITFADVGGLEELKEKIRLRVIYPLRRPELYQAFGKRVGGGLLLYGPPGCGKTFLARAAAGEAGLHFLAIGIEEVLDMWLGQSEKKLHELFATARAKAPAVLFFDEVDALGGRRSGLRHESYRTLVTQFLAELDGARGTTAGVLVIGATNAPWDIDPAFRRPGRFGEVLFVPPPDLRARVEILKLKLRGRPVAADVDVTVLARQTEHYSGADLDELVERATEAALEESLRGGGIRPVSAAELGRAATLVRPTTLEWLATARSFVEHANASGQFDEVRDYLKRYHL